MSNKQVQLRRGTTAQTNVFTGAVGELTVDTDKNALILHDGATQGGKVVGASSVVNVKDYGAKGDGVTDDTNAIQAAINAVTPQTQNGYGRLYFPAGTYIVKDTLTLGSGGMQMSGDPYGSIIKYDKESNYGAVIEKSTSSGLYGWVIENLNIDTNNKATHGFYFASVGVFQAIKNVRFSNVYVLNLGSGSIGWQLGDQTNTGLDTDAWNWNFFTCHARGNNGSIGWHIDANNAYNIGWYNCSGGRASVGNEMLSWIKTIRGSGYRLYNFFGDKLQSSGTAWGIDHGGGLLEVYGLSTEDARVIKARSLGQADSRLFMSGVSVNDTTRSGEISVDSTIETNLQSCVFGYGNYNQIIKCTNDLTTNQNQIGSSSFYDLDVKRRCVLEGHIIGDFKNELRNGAFSLWRGTAIDNEPLGWVKNSGGGTLTLQQSTSNAVNGRYTTYINVTGAATGGDVAGMAMQSAFDVSQYRGTRISVFALGTRLATEAPQMKLTGNWGTTGIVQPTLAYTESSSGGRFLIYGFVDVPSNATYLNSIKIGLYTGNVGQIYLDSVGVSPFNWSTYVPALYAQASNQKENIQDTAINSGYLPLGREAFRLASLGITPPTTGSWNRGDMMFNQNATAGGKIGWICVSGGTPGTWKTFGSISA